jgi:hypothetical protein
MRRNKYGNRKTTVDGVEFDSAAEAARYRDLKLMESCGLIRGLTLHPRYTLLEAFTDRTGQRQRAIVYEADFSYFDEDDGAWIVEDVKGVKTAVFRLKRKLFLKRYPEFVFRVEAV